MAISQLQLPGPIRDPQIDWSRLDAIGDTIARGRAEARDTEGLVGMVDTLPTRGAGVMGQAPAPAARPDAAPGLDDLIAQTAQRNGINPQALRRYVQIESGGRPDLVSPSGRHGGLLQIGADEYTKRGGKNLFDPAENLEIGAQRLRENTEVLKRRLGRDPTPTELYLSHQQGIGGVAAHMAAPDRPAWQSMLSTAEGREKGEAWAKAAVWGNVPDRDKQRFGSVDNMTSRDFLELWRGRVEAPGQPAAAAPAPAAQSGAERVGAALRSIEPAQAEQLKQMIRAGGQSRQVALARIAQITKPRDPVKLNEGEVLVDGDEPSRVLARGQDKTITLRPGGVAMRGGQVVAQAPNAPSTGEREEDKFQGRQRIAERLGMKPDDPETKRYLATGQVPGSDKVTPTQFKMIADAEDENLNLNGTIEVLSRARALNGKIFTGATAGARTWLGTQLKDGLVPDFIADPQGAQATEEWSKLMEPEALQTMARTLKGATTDFELRTFIKQLADPTTTPQTRLAVIDRLERMAKRNIAINQNRMDQIRGGTYTRPGGGESSGAPAARPQPPAGGVPPAAAEQLRSDPSHQRQRQFDEIFGRGAASRVLKGN